MSQSLLDHTIIQTRAELDAFYQTNQDIRWMGFDTEFMGEKRFYTLLCLIQVATEHGYYLIDPIAIKDISPFLELMRREDIIKITHAGENDYRILFNQYDTLPKNLFDTQVAGGFIGYKYPLAFRHLLRGELGIHINKSYAVTAWDDRPLQQRQIEYALNDVIYLRQLYDSMTAKLEQRGMLDWALEECARYEQADYYTKDPDDEALRHSMMHKLKPREKLFLLRLMRWRRQQAEKRNHSLEMVFSKKYIGPFVNSVGSGMNAIRSHRRLSDRLVNRHAAQFLKMYERPATDEELATLKRVPPPERPDEPSKELVLEFIYLLIKQRALDEDIAIGLMPAKSAVKRLREEPDLVNGMLAKNWRAELLGPEMMGWLQNISHLRLHVEGGNIQLLNV